MSIIKKAEFIKSSAKLSECPADDVPEYAFIGRSNVGKSSLINMLTDKTKLAKISSKPGKTQLINHFRIDDTWYLVDLPGYGWARVSKKEKERWKIMINNYLQKRENLINIFLLIDIRIEPQKIDLDFIEDLGMAGIPFSLIFTKADKLGKNKVASNVAFYKKVLKKQWEDLPPIFISSAVSRQGQNEIIDYIQHLNSTVKT